MHILRKSRGSLRAIGIFVANIFWHFFRRGPPYDAKTTFEHQKVTVRTCRTTALPPAGIHWPRTK